MKTVLFCPGFMEVQQSRNYDKLLAVIRKAGYNTKFVPIQWKRTTAEDWACQLKDVYAHYDPADVVLAGFSQGALTSFVVASERPLSELWLCSLSPYFAEDFSKLKPAWLRIHGKHRTEAFRQLSFTDLATKVAVSRALVFIGEQEIKRYPLTLERCEAAVKSLPNARLIKVTAAAHDVTHPNYIAAIQANII